MAKLNLKSENQILGDMASLVLANTGLNDLNPGSILLTLLQVAAQEDFQQYYQMLQIVRNYNIDTTTGSDLDNRAFEYGLTRELATRATGKIQILREESFEKISTSYFIGFRSRITGDTEIFVNDASDFPSSGTNTLILGRGTPNEEEVTYTGTGTNPENNTNYFKITLDSPLTNDHSHEEDVILKQGTDIIIPAGTVVIVPASGTTAEVRFTTVHQVTILSGEDLVDDVDIKATDKGISGNIGVNAIIGTEAFPNPIFPGQRALNNSAFSNGLNKETDTKLRSRIKSAIQAVSQSTPAGITNAIAGLVDPDTAKRLVSSNIILPDNVGLPVKIYIDDGTGFEPSFVSRGEEIILESAAGTEQRLQLDLFPLVKAQVETLNEEPFDMSTNGLTLNVSAGTQSEVITFFTTDFANSEAAVSEEITKAINNSSDLIEARTSQVGKRIVINAKADINEEIQVTGGTANTADRLNFSTDKIFTFYLYKNDKLLFKDGQTAFVDAANTQTYDFSSDAVLSVVVDGKTANTQTVDIFSSDFDSPAASAVATAQEVADAINLRLAGATASDGGGFVKITSNLELSSDSKIKINTSTANTILGFPTTEVVGADNDYTLNAELGVIDLEVPLVENEIISAGTRFTRSFLTAVLAGPYTFSGGETLDIQIDGGSTQTITFSALVGQTASQVAAIINNTLVAGTAEVRTVGTDSFLEIRTNLFEETTGTIEILGTSTANSIFEFTLDSLITNGTPHTAAVVSQGTPFATYDFVEDDSLVVIFDNNPASKTFIVNMDFGGTVSSGTSTSIFDSSGFSTIFTSDDELNDYYTIFKSGANTTTGTVVSVTNPTPNNYRFFYDTPPTNFADFTVGDQISVTDMAEDGNNGNFLVTTHVIQGTVYTAVLDRDLSNPSALTPIVGDRYLIAPAANTAITAPDIEDKDVSNPSALSPSVSDAYIVAPGANSVKLDPAVDKFASSSQATATHGFRYLIDRTPVITQTSALSIESDPSVLLPILGDRYLIGTSPTPISGWVGLGGQIAEYVSGSPALVGSWTYTVPAINYEILIVSGGLTYFYDGASWGVNDWVGQDWEIAEYNGVGSPGWLYTTPNDEDVMLTSTTLYQFDQGSGTWIVNDWGGSEGQIAVWTGSAWSFGLAIDGEVRNVLDESLKYQYTLGTNTWAQNDWGGNATEIAEWTGASWSFTVPSVNDVVDVTDESITVQFTGAAWIIFSFWIEVNNPAGVIETGATGTGLLGQRRLISDYVTSTGQITLSTPLTTATPSASDTFIVLPRTNTNVVEFFNNSNITSITSQSEISIVKSTDKMQIASLLDSSNGAVQITGGSANDKLLFSTTLKQGLQSYNYYTGLVKLAHRTIYGDETDLVSFPGVGAAGVKFQILPPTVQEISISIEVALSEGFSLSQVETDIKTEILSYINNLGISEAVILSNIIDRVVTITSVLDAKITLPTENTDVSENELARSKASLISVELI